MIEQFTGKKPVERSGSTDCNICFSLGIAGCCFGGYEGTGAHTKEEKVDISSLNVGMKIVMSFMLEFFENIF